MRDAIVIIGANEFQLPLVLKANELGFDTHVFAWRRGAVAAPFAHRFYPISITERDLILAECRRIAPKAVLTIASDLGALTAAYICGKLGLPSDPMETAERAVNKYLTREAFLNNGVKTPRFASVSSVDEALSAASQMRLPVIVKPTDRSGSRAVTRLVSLDGLCAAAEAALECSFENRAIIEEFIGGPEYSCECISQNGEHHMLAVTKKFTTGAPHYIEVGHAQPSGLDENALVSIKDAVFAALDALGIKNGPTHTEFRLTDGGEVFIIEVGPRMGGDCIGSDLVGITTGYDYLGLTIEAALGLPLTLARTAGGVLPPGALGPLPEPSEGGHPAAAVRFIMNRRDLEGIERIRRDPVLSKNIVRISDINIGAEGSVCDSSSRFGFAVFACGTAREARELAMLGEDLYGE